jgi:hypothetical protein
MDRFARPYQNPSITVRVPVRPPPEAPRVTNSGAKCSVRGCARRTQRSALRDGLAVAGARLRAAARQDTARQDVGS